jgi:hypothetical protein
LVKKEDARVAIVREWRRLPAEKRASERQAFYFAKRAISLYRWRASGDPDQEVMAWLLRYIGQP